jgi:acetyl-CoA carboxylase carboxyl transferase beta subunit
MPRLAPRLPLPQREPPAEDRPSEPAASCERCASPLAGDLYDRYRICPGCGLHGRRSARETIDALVDPGSFREMDARLASSDPLQFVDDVPYRERLEATRQRTGEADAAITGSATIRGHQAIVAALDFNFLGGSMGVVVGEKIARAAERAGRERKPLVTVVASGGARMQEGMLSLLQMAKTAAATKRLHDRGVPYVSVLTNPTTGGVFASFANLGDVILAEPGALIGFAGPRVAEQAIGRKLPPGTHTAEFLFEHGMVDAIVDRRDLADRIGDLLAIFAAPRAGFRRRPLTVVPPPAEAEDVWAIVRGPRAASPASPCGTPPAGRGRPGAGSAPGRGRARAR